MDELLIIAAAMVLAGAGLAAARLALRRRGRRDLDLLRRQYQRLFQGGLVSEAVVQSARVRLEATLAGGDVHAIERLFGPGPRHAVVTRAFAEINSELTREALERQLDRRIAADPMEQAWYRLDLARNLRRMNRLASTAPLLRAAAEDRGPLAHLLAAEAASIAGFAGFMHQVDWPLGRWALTVMRRTLDGIDAGVDPGVIAAGRLGEAVEILWDQRIEEVHPGVVRALAAAARFLQRVDQVRGWFSDEDAAGADFDEQALRMEALADGLAEFLADAPAALLERLHAARGDAQAEILAALDELRAECASEMIALLESGACTAPDSALAVLAHSSDASVGVWVRTWIGRGRHAIGRRGANPSYLAALRVLRRHPAGATEELLTAALGDRRPPVRLAALRSLGWWTPIRLRAILPRLEAARRDRACEIRAAAEAALARLGERRALNWFRQQLEHPDPDVGHRAIERAAAEGLVLLWPDLDALAQSGDRPLSFHAGLALHRMREQLKSSIPLT